MPPALFNDLLLYFRDSPAIKKMVGERDRSVWYRLNSRRQLIYCIVHRLAEIIQPLSIHSPIEGFTDISTGQPELDVVLFTDHRVLVMCEPGTSHRRRRKLTRIIVRRTPTEPNTALAGVMLESSFARFKPSMATSSEERTPSRPFGRWDLSTMVERNARERCDVKAVKSPKLNRDERPSCYRTPRAILPIR